MLKGQIVAGDFAKIVMRVKADQQVELGELLVLEGQELFLLQVYDLTYGSQVSQQNLELVAGINLEQGNHSLLESSLRNYQLAYLKPILAVDQGSKACKKLPPFFGTVRTVTKDDLSFITTPFSPLPLGKLRNGSGQLDFTISLPGKDTLSHHILIPASTGKGKSNLMSCILWEITAQSYAGMLVLDPHDEYYGRTGKGLKNHSQQEQLLYYTPAQPPPGAQSLRFNISLLKPHHFAGAISLSDPQRQCFHAYYKAFKEQWIPKLLAEEKIANVRFHEDTLAVVKRRLVSLLGLSYEQEQLKSDGIFTITGGEQTVTDICQALEKAKTVIIDTSYFSGAVEILIASLITSEIFDKYKYYKRVGQLSEKPVVSIVLEEAPRVLGKQVLEQGTNIFSTIAREGRKFQVGLIAITQLPSEIPKTVLANMNTKIILGIEMSTERQAVIESSPQDLSQDNRTIAALDKGEAIVTSTFTKFAVPLKIPFFGDVVREEVNKIQRTYPGFSENI